MADSKISALTDYTTPLNADVLPIVDTANSITKKVSWANIKATLKTYFDTLYPSGSGTSTGTNTGDQIISDATITTTDITTNNFTTSKHGFVPKGTNVGSYLKDDGTWAAVSPTNASTTAKGVVEAATSAEVTAGTATGSTGAVLAVTPDALAASTPVFNGSGLTGTTKISATAAPITQLASTSAENTIYTVSIPGGTLGTSNAIVMRGFPFPTNTTGGNVTYTYRLKYGATTMHTYVETVATGTSFVGTMEWILFAKGSTAVQSSEYSFVGQLGANPEIKCDGAGAATEDSTATKNLVLTVQMNTSSANATFDFRDFVVYKIN